ncbi:MAG: AAA family ATPase [Bacilli bacterium]|nr:AAA family ATPase [Bacilli bacterium]
MKINYDVAMLMKSVKICDGYIMFVPVHAITGKFKEDEGYFETLDGYSYYSLDNYIGDLDSPEDFTCTYIMKGKDFFNKFLNHNTLRNALTQYKNEYSDFKMIYYDAEYEKNRCIQFDLSRFEHLGNNENPVLEENVSVTDDDISLDLDIKKINDKHNALIKFVDDHKEDESILDDLWVSLEKTSKSYIDIMSKIIFLRRNDDNLELVNISDKEESTKKGDRTEKEINKKEYYQKRKKIIDEIKDVIKGHDKEVERFVTEIFRLRNQYGNKNRGILLTGSTGVGKTKMCELISEKLDVPCKIIDTTQLTMPGYKGKDIEDFLDQLYDAQNGDLDKVEHSIIVFNEVDKKGSGNNYDVSGKGVLNQLLSFLDGTEYTIKDSTYHSPNEKRTISTKNMLVIFAGSFTSIYQNPKFNKHSMGFTNKEIITKEPTINDYVELGGMPDESIGRFPVIIHLEDLTKEDLKDILINSKESPIKYSKLEFMGEAGVELEFTNDAINLIALEAYKEKTGARSLNKIVEYCTSLAFSKVTDNIGMYKKVIITKETVLDNSKFKTIKNLEDIKKYIYK